MKKTILLLCLFFTLFANIGEAIEVERDKNVATYVVFPLIDSADDVSYQSAATSPDSEIDAWADGSAPDGFADCTNEATEIGSTGIYYLSLTQAETNYDYIVIQIKASDANTQTILINTKVKTDVSSILTDTAAMDTSTELRTLLTGSDTAVSTLTTSDNIGINLNDVSGTLDAVEISTDAITADKIAAGAITSSEAPNLDAAVSSRSTLTAANVWETDISAYSGVGYAGTYLKNLYDNQDWNPWDAGTRTLTAGTKDTEIDAIKVKTDNLPVDPADDSDIDSQLATIAGYIDTEVADILTDTGTTIPGQISGLNDLSAAQVNSEVDVALSDIGLDHLLGASVTGTDVVDNSIIAYMVSKSATADWNSFVNTTDSLEAIRDNQTGADAAAIADAVWDEAMSGHTGDGTFGGDFLDADIWTSTRAGYLDNLNGHTAQTGDSYAVVTNVTYGLSAIETLVDDLESSVSDILTDTAAQDTSTELRILLTGSDTAVSTVTTTQVNAEVVDVVETDNKLNLLIVDTSTLSSDVALGSILGQLFDDGTAWSYDRSTGALEAISGLAGGTDWSANEKTEIKAVLGITNTGTPDSTPSDGALYAIQGATFATGTDSLEAIRNHGDAAWITATGFSTHSAADVWTAVSRTITGLTTAALADFFDTDSGETYSSAVSGSVVKETADNAGGGSSDWTSNEKTEIKEVLGVTGTGTPGDPSQGILDTIRDLIKRIGRNN